MPPTALLHLTVKVREGRKTRTPSTLGQPHEGKPYERLVKDKNGFILQHFRDNENGFLRGTHLQVKIINRFSTTRKVLIIIRFNLNDKGDESNDRDIVFLYGGGTLKHSKNRQVIQAVVLDCVFSLRVKVQVI